MENKEKIIKKTKKNNKKIKETEDFKRKYFEYYDDIKSSTHKIVDW